MAARTNQNMSRHLKGIHRLPYAACFRLVLFEERERERGSYFYTQSIFQSIQLYGPSQPRTINSKSGDSTMLAIQIVSRASMSRTAAFRGGCRSLSVCKMTTMSEAAMSRQFMSSMSVAHPEEQENHFALILGKPGGGKGTISGKILKVGGSSGKWCSFFGGKQH
jgi:hypothetical protein